MEYGRTSSFGINVVVSTHHNTLATYSGGSELGQAVLRCRLGVSRICVTAPKLAKRLLGTAAVWKESASAPVPYPPLHPGLGGELKIMGVAPRERGLLGNLTVVGLRSSLECSICAHGIALQ